MTNLEDLTETPLPRLETRRPDSNKGDFGRALLIGRVLHHRNDVHERLPVMRLVRTLEVVLGEAVRAGRPPWLGRGPVGVEVVQGIDPRLGMGTDPARHGTNPAGEIALPHKRWTRASRADFVTH